MTRTELIQNLTLAIAENEGFFVTQSQARDRKIPFPTRAQLNANPGNIRVWSDSGNRPYPKRAGYVDFLGWARGDKKRATEEGWRVLRVLAWQYIAGRYTDGMPPTVEQMFSKYAPEKDGNDPDRYARFVAGRLGIKPSQRLVDLITT